MGLLLFLIIYYLLSCYGLSLLFKKAGVESSKAWIPGVNFVIWAKLIGKSPVSTLWMLFPIVNLFTFSSMAVDIIRSFGKTSFLDTALSVLVAPYIFWKTGTDDSSYNGPILTQEKKFFSDFESAVKSGNKYDAEKLANINPYKKPIWREWTESIFFAVFAATFIRMFLIEAFVIPTPSMEGSLNVGDYLFVSKAHYGIRTPRTIAMLPLLHNRIPGLNKESYLKEPSLNMYRFPALEQIEVGKPIVFNWPVGDSIYLTAQRSYFPKQVELVGDPALLEEVKKGNLITRPIDKKDHYIKRCMGIGGDTLLIVDRQVFINGKAVPNPEKIQYNYAVNVQNFSAKKLEEMGINQIDFAGGNADGSIYLALDKDQVEKLKSMGVDPRIVTTRPGGLFPFDERYSEWTVDNYGPIVIPGNGQTIAIDTANIAMYERAISVYEGNTLEVKNYQIYINGQVATSYTFKQDYYWAMGDNRHNSEDSRMWGFVPFDHIVGKPLFIFMSAKEGVLSKGINWDRLFKYAGAKQ